MVTSVEQTVTGKKVFENIEVHDPTSNNQAANKSYADTKLSLTGGTMTGDLILPHHNYPIPGNTNKVINYESQREIFLSRRESFPMQADINMNNKFIQNIATPTLSHQVTNKGYCDYNFLNRQKGGVLMGPLSMNRNDLIEIPDTPKFDHSAVNKKYVDGEITKIPPTDTSPFLKLDGTRVMTGDLDMDSHKITNLNLPTNDNDASNKQYIDEKLLKSHLLSSEVVNAFKYLSEVDESATISNIYIHGVVDYNGSPHKNKKAYDIDMVYSLGVQNYTSKLGINLYPLDVTGKYTIIMEYYFSPDNTNINIIAEVTKTTTIKKQTTFDETNYKKYLVQFDFPSKANPPHFLYFTISGTGTTSTNPEGYLVFYGVKGWDDAVPSEIYDHALETGMFEYDNGNIKMYHDIDMDSHRIKNIHPPTIPTDLLMKQSLDIRPIIIFGMVRSDTYFSINGIKLTFNNIHITYIELFGEQKHLNTQDALMMSVENNNIQQNIYLRFRFSSHQTNIILNINKSFDLVFNFSMDTSKNIPFKITYLPITFK